VNSIPVVLSVVLEYENEVATEVVVVDTDVVLDDVVVVELKVVTVLARVTARKFEAKSRPSPAGQLLPDGATLQAWTVIK
jgi:hypothetical protein